MKLDNQQKAILKSELNKSLNILGKEPKVNVDEYVEKDFQGVELVMVLMAFKKAGIYEDNN